MKYINKGDSDMGIQVKWIDADTTSEYSSEQMELSIRFDEPTDEEKQIYFALKKKVHSLGKRKKQHKRSNVVVEADDHVPQQKKRSEHDLVVKA